MALRPDLDVILQLVPDGARVLDLGCGDGALLAALGERKGIEGRGVEVDEGNVRACVGRGLSVRHGNIEEGLADFPDAMFDVVILSQTLAYLNRPLPVLAEMARVGRSAIISLENGGHWRARWRSLRGGGGGTPLMSDEPRVRIITLSGFHDALGHLRLRIEERVCLGGGRRVRLWPSLRADALVFRVAREIARAPVVPRSGGAMERATDAGAGAPVDTTSTMKSTHPTRSAQEIAVPHRRRVRRLFMAALAPLLALLVSGPVGAQDSLLTSARSLFEPLPKVMASPDNPITPEKVALGRMLFFDPRMSEDGTVSCSRCHQPGLYATDALPKPIGAQHRVNPRNAPTVFNAALQFAAHWRGDRKSVEDQATQALIGPPSFGNPNYDAAMAKIRAIPGYRDLFGRAFPGQADPITPENWGKAIGAYERTLVTPGPFDAYLGGDENALSADAKAGLRDFIDVGCATCHKGPGVGGGMFQKFGLVEEYGKATGSATIDKGRFDVTHEEKDLYVFKVPVLRNIAHTPPYFHDGSVASLADAVRIMARVQLGKNLSDAQVTHLLAFLGALTGPEPANFATAVVLPAAGFQPGKPQTNPPPK